ATPSCRSPSAAAASAIGLPPAASDWPLAARVPSTIPHNRAATDRAYACIVPSPKKALDRKAPPLGLHLKGRSTHVQAATAKNLVPRWMEIDVDWEHHFEEKTPAYLQLSRAGLTLHLSEHHGDACPGSTVFVWMVGIASFHQRDHKQIVQVRFCRRGRP